MYDLLPKDYYPKTIYISPKDAIEDVKTLVREHGFQYPFVVKPDIGMKGLLFRKLDREEDLEFYHSKNVVDYIIQELVDYPLEVSVFYYRYPDEEKGVITGFIQKELMDLYGDGKSTLLELIEKHPKGKRPGPPAGSLASQQRSGQSGEARPGAHARPAQQNRTGPGI